MSIKKVTIASLILLSLAACSSGSGSSQNGTGKKSTPSIQESNKQNNSNQTSKSEAERLKAEEAARLAKEKTGEERLKAEEAARLAKEKAEAERLKAEEAARLAKEKAEAERLKAEEAARLAKEKAEAERLKAGEAARLAKEKAETERTQAKIQKIYEQFIAAGADEHYAKAYAEKYANVDDKIVANDLAKFKKERFEQKLRSANVPEEDIKMLQEERFNEKHRERFLQAAQRMKELGVEYDSKRALYHADNSWETLYKTSLEELLRAERAYVLGVEGEKASKFAESYSSYNDKETKEEIDNKLANFLKDIKENQYKSGLNMAGDKLIYNQTYSITTMLKGSGNNHSRYDAIIAKGLETKAERIPDEGKATYKGQAFGSFNQNGELTYSVDFNERVGEGKIVGEGIFNSAIAKNTLILEKGEIVGNSITSSTKTGDQEIDRKYSGNNNYELKFFGPKAEEIGGKAIFGGYTFGLAGTRGEITK